MSSFKSKLLNGFAWRLCLYVSSFVLNIFIANKFQAQDSGVFYLLINNIAFIVLFLSLGIDSAIAYFGSRKEIQPGTLLLISICWSILASVLLLFGYIILVRIGWAHTHILAPWIFVNAGCTLLANCIASILFSTNDNRTPNIVFTLINVVLLLVLLVNFQSVSTSTYISYTKSYLLISSAPGIVFVFYMLFKNRGNIFSLPQKTISKKFIWFSLQAFVYTMLYTLLLRCDYWLVNYFCNSSDLGNYLQATKISQIILLVPTLASFALFPLIVNHVHEEKAIDSKLIKLISVYFYIGLIMCVCLIATGYWIFPLFYGETFSKIYSSFVLLTPGILMLAASYPLSTYFSGRNMIRLKITALSFSIVLLLALDLLLIPYLNIYGAAISSAIAYTFYLSYLLLKFRKTHPFRLTDIFRLGPIIRQNIPSILKGGAGEKDR